MLYRGFFFQAEDGIRDLVRSRGLGDVYKRQDWFHAVYTITTKALAFTLVPLVSKMFFDDCAII